MQSFLEKTVDYLYEKYGDNVSELCIVLPNRRAGLFLKTHFSKRLNKVFWAPEIYATEDFIALLAELEITDTTTQLFELYETVKHVNPEQQENFNDFSKWGQILLSDLNEIDRYLVDASQLFGNLKDIKELESWSLNKEEELTDFQKQYLNFWKSIGSYYTDFTQRLLSKNQAYQGLAYRIVADKTEQRVSKHNWKKIIFAGFNALNKAEERIIETLVNANKAEIIWDADAYYLNNTNQEAGRFIRRYNDSGLFKNIKENNILFKEELLSSEQKSITLIGAAKNVAQAKVAGNLIAELQEQFPSLQTTALVLADENLLFPVLHSLPDNLMDINVTMGYPLKNTPVAGYFDLVFSMHENALKLSKGKIPYSYYHSDVIKILSHPYTAIALSSSDRRSIKKAVHAIQERNIVFASQSLLASVFSEFKYQNEWDHLQPVFEYWKTPADALACIHYLVDALKQGIIENLDAENKVNLELEYLFAFTKIIKRVRTLMSIYHSIQDVITLRGILNQLVRGTTLPFYGEPLMGLQVMGMLETRTLDFENVILLSCNEDILPSAKAINSFIPFELKRFFGLPTYMDKDAIFSYHFYRLIQRATTIYLVYNTESDALGSGEKSRFLTQLLYELPKVNPNVNITEKLVNIPIVSVLAEQAISIKKTPVMLEALKEKAAYGFSPSVLNKYRNCSLEFYFHVIAGLRAAEEIEENIGADTLGNSIHEVLETLYTPVIGKKLTIAHLEEMKQRAEQLTLAAFEKKYSKSEISYGKNLLTLKVALKFIANFLKLETTQVEEAEKKGSPILIKALENELEAELMVNGAAVKIKGKADRIDSVGAITRIIDYKTGIAENKELKLEEWEDIRTEANLAKSFQLLMYALMYQKMNPAITDNLVSGIISFRELSEGLKTVKVHQQEVLNASVLHEFELQVKQIISDIFDPAIPFAQTTELDNCAYCLFKGICNR
jgi:ATP-dependent helicase/nuclease subunit B